MTLIYLRPCGGAAATVILIEWLSGRCVKQRSAVTTALIIPGFKLIGQVQNVYIYILDVLNFSADTVGWVRSATPVVRMSQFYCCMAVPVCSAYYVLWRHGKASCTAAEFYS